VYYQKGVGGKGLRNLLFGGKCPFILLLLLRRHLNEGSAVVYTAYHPGAFSLGLSANVRAAYGFLAHNYEEGDQIYFFGFSRGAYTARAIAGLVAGMGLLNKRGMDSFHKVYDEYYSQAEKRSKPKLDTPLIKGLKEQKMFHPRSVQEAVEIVGVWDTVGFHQTWFARLLDALHLSELLGTKGEKIEFYNTGLSPNVRYGFHALALDEKRRPYRPTLWGAPDPSAQKKVAWNSMSSTSNTASGPGSPSSRQREISQVWFSGAHSDIGGGLKDHRLSDISLAWMISQCSKDADAEYTLSFDKEYLKSDQTPSSRWATCKGERKELGYWHFMAQLLGWFTAAPRWPLAGQNANANTTGEYIHRSIADRYFGTNKPQGATPWPCAQLTGANCASGWALRGGRNPIKEFRAGSAAELDEDSYNGCVRDADEDWKQVLAR
jgi:hypothetical protein